MMAVARLVKDRRRTVARTLRETFGVGLTDLGDGLSWGEAKLLLEEAAADPSTALGAELAGWSYPATHVDLFSLIATIGNKDAAMKVMPWAFGGGRQSASDAEIAAANAELEASIVFS